MKVLPTIKDVARLSGTSRSAVSRYLNKHEGVSEDASQRISAAINKLNYQPNRLAQGLATGTKYCLGVIAPRILTQQIYADPFIAPVFDGIYRVAQEMGFSVMVWLLENQAEGDELYEYLSQSCQIDGAVVIAAPSSNHIYRKLEQVSLPFVTVGRFKGQHDYFVDIDHEEAAFQAVNHLIRMGYQRIAAITCPLDSTAGYYRFAGYKKALFNADMDINLSRIVDCQFDENKAYLSTPRLIENDCDAIFCMSDSMAIGALRAVQESGRRVPEDIAIVGFDDVPRATLVRPALTTVHQPLFRFGEEAAKLMFNVLANQTRARVIGPQHVYLPTKLVMRASA